MITTHSYPWLDADLNKLMKTKKNVHIIKMEYGSTYYLILMKYISLNNLFLNII